MGRAVARPCGNAERLPAATMVSNDMPSAPPRRAANSNRPATSDSGTPERIEGSASSYTDAPSFTASRMMSQLVCVFDDALLHDEPDVAFQAIFLCPRRRRSPAAATVVRSPSKPMLGDFSFAMTLPAASSSGPFGNDHAGALDLLTRLLGIAAIGKEDGPRIEEEQQPVAAGVSAQIPQVRRMRDDEAVQTLGVDVVRELFLARAIVHVTPMYDNGGAMPLSLLPSRASTSM